MRKWFNDAIYSRYCQALSVSSTEPEGEPFWSHFFTGT
jgi:hypothetical protein